MCRSIAASNHNKKTISNFFGKSLIGDGVDAWLGAAKSEYLNDIKTPQQLKKLNLKDILLHSLSYDQQQLLQELAPEKLEVPSGSKIKINYDTKNQPILAVRLQEVFGMNKTPKINQGKINLLMHLLSPGFKPVQVTSDLQSFWKETYFEVKKELKNVWDLQGENVGPQRLLLHGYVIFAITHKEKEEYNIGLSNLVYNPSPSKAAFGLPADALKRPHLECLIFRADKGIGRKRKLFFEA